MKFESEIITEKFLPAARTVIAKVMKEDYGHEQYEIAEQLSVTQPAVSQYLREKRADQQLISRLEKDPQTKVLLEEAASKAAKNESFDEELSEVLEVARAKGFLGSEFSDAGCLR